MDAAAGPAARAARVALAALLTVAACTSGGGDEDGPAGSAATTIAPAPPGTAAGGLRWTDRGDGIETATLTVPLDHDEPDGGTVELFLARHPARDPERRIGTLLVNPGGPGVGGSEMVMLAQQAFGDPLLERFDIVGWDPRGTGRSTPAIDCIDDLDAHATAPEPLGPACVERSGDWLADMGTNASARDIDAIRRALGEDTISYLGFSYGSELGATWATMFPDTVRAAVLDGAADPTADLATRLLQRAAGFEAALDRYLDAAGPDAAAELDALLARLDEAPIPSRPGRPRIDRRIAAQAIAQAMYHEGLWDQLTEALAAARRGDGSGLLMLWDSYLLRRPDGTWPNTVEAGQVITCMDHAERYDAATADQVDARIAAAASRMAAGLHGADMCRGLPVPDAPRIEVTGAGAGPIVVVGTTGDPATPLASTRAMADALEDGHLVVVTANQHTGYGANACIEDVVHRYLVDLTIPPEHTTC